LPKDARDQSTYRLKIYAIIGSTLISILVIFVSPHILPILFPQFQDAVDLIPIMGLSIVPHVFTMLYISKFLSSENSKLIVISSVLHFVILVSSILILTHYYSTMGLVIAFVLGEIGEALFLMFMHKKFFKVYI
jgi:O-antigen/teichoic acid export membrane protein